MTDAPSSPSRMHVAVPIPPAPPATSTTRPFSPRIRIASPFRFLVSPASWPPPGPDPGREDLDEPVERGVGIGDPVDRLHQFEADEAVDQGGQLGGGDGQLVLGQPEGASTA